MGLPIHIVSKTQNGTALGKEFGSLLYDPTTTLLDTYPREIGTNLFSTEIPTHKWPLISDKRQYIHTTNTTQRNYRCVQQHG